MFFSKTGAVQRKSRDSKRVSSLSTVTTIKCKLVFGVSNAPGFDNSASYDKWRIYTRDGSLLQHDIITIDGVPYVIDAKAKHEGIMSTYWVYFVTK